MIIALINDHPILLCCTSIAVLISRIAHNSTTLLYGKHRLELVHYMQKRDGDLRCPVDSHVGNGIEVYSNFLEVVEKFCKFDALPVDIKYEGENLAGLMYQKKS